jgi:uncharacterized protein YfaS (alpha-2-macroglobulin family)
VARVHVEVEASADMSWVAVTDPLPAGAAILGTGLGRDSTLLSGPPAGAGRPSLRPAYEERAFDAFRAYYETLPRGRWSVVYTLRFNQDGAFHLPPTRVEALYAPEMHGELPNDVVAVAP